MIDMRRDKIIRCFQLILEKKYSDARNLLKPKDNHSGPDTNPGIKFAIEGIIDFLTNESKEKQLRDVDRLKKLCQFFKRKSSSSWSDDFDRKYFETWIGFLNFLQRQMESRRKADSIMDNPSKEPESYEAT